MSTDRILIHADIAPAEISKTMMNNQTFDDWTWIYKVNVASYYFTSAAFLPLLCAARDNGFTDAGSILNISSISGITNLSQNGQFSYNASKAAIHMLSESLRLQLADTTVELVEIVPPSVATELMPGQQDSPIAMPSAMESSVMRPMIA